MRDFIPSCTVNTVRSVSAAILVLSVGCHSPTYLAITAAHDAYATTGDVDPTTEAIASDTIEASSGSAGESTNVGTDAGDAGDATGSSEAGAVSATGDASTTGSSEETGETDTGEPAALPSIVSLSLPAKVYAAGPVKIEVLTEHTLSVQLEVDGVGLGALADAGDGLFVGALAVRGAIDNGLHSVRVIAQQGPHEVDQTQGYEVSTPKPGTMAWFQAGPAGSRTNRVALTADGDVLEAGQIEINKVKRPGLRKRSGLTGAELWWATLDTREGEVADLAVLPDGRMWAAMNVRKPGDPSPQPRIALFDAAGKFAGVETFGDFGRVVRGIAADADGGCFAAGYAPAGKDLDIAYWRITAAGLATLNDKWDYVRDPIKDPPHSFSEFAMDVVLKDDVAWIIGASNGKHVDPVLVETRGILVPMQLNTGTVKDPVIVAAKGPYYTQSVFFGAGHHPLGVLVTGYGCDDGCSNYQIQTALYGPTGLRLWQTPDTVPGSLRYGSDVVLDSQGRALVAGIVTEKGTPRGYLSARRVGGEEVFPLLEHWFPVSAAPSEALGVLVDAYDRIFAGGYITANGSTQARLVLIHG
jgi:hypothetical protein